MLRLRSVLACVAAHVALAHVCAADSFPRDYVAPPPPRFPPFSYAWTDPRMVSRIGVGVTIGAGMTGFASDIRSFINRSLGVTWNVRVAVGTHIPLCIELGYMGSIAKLQTLMEDFNGMLLGTTLEGALRWNILPHWYGTPYVFAGGGWQRYSVQHPQFPEAVTGLTTEDSVAEFPIGAGMAYRGEDGWTGDVRVTMRLTTKSTLLVEPNSDENLDAWEFSAAIGYNF